MNILNFKNDVIISKTELLREFQAGCKPREKFKIGIEYERLLVNKKSYKTVPYYGDKGVYRLLRQIAFKDEWKYISDFGNVIGLSKSGNSVTLEPGGQFEISLAPQDSIKQIEKEIQKLDKKFLAIAKNLDIIFLNCGVSPVSTYKDISLIPKRRYSVMSKALPGDLLSTMMRETAGIQVSMDYESEADAMKKLQVALKVSPIMTAMFANSPIYDSKKSGFKSYRALSWLFTDNKRCGLISKKLFESDGAFSFRDYIDVILSLPMLYIVRNNNIIELNQKINFNDFIRNGYGNFSATINDFKLHSSLFFPECRLNSYLEIRNHDCQKGALKYSIPAIYKGIFYCSHSMNEVLNLFKELSYEDFVFARETVPRYGLDAQLGKHRIQYYAENLIQIAKKYLKNDKFSESKYIEPIEELVASHLSPADVVLQNWNNNKIVTLIDILKE